MSKIVAQEKPNDKEFEKFFRIKEKQKVVLNDKERKKYREKLRSSKPFTLKE